MHQRHAKLADDDGVLALDLVDAVGEPSRMYRRLVLGRLQKLLAASRHFFARGGNGLAAAVGGAIAAGSRPTLEVTISGNSALAISCAASSMARCAGSGVATPSGRTVLRRACTAGFPKTSRGKVRYTGPRGSLMAISTARSTT